MFVRGIASAAPLIVVLLQPVHAREPLPACPRSESGAWVVDARWYYIVVPRFHNGDTAHDPAGTIAWAADFPAAAAVDQTPADEQQKEWQSRRYGGDLQGIIQRLPYLKELGVNALCLSPVFHGDVRDRLQQPDLRHIDPTLAESGDPTETNDEGSDPASWKWSASDRVFLGLLKKAHEAGFRVVIGGLFGAITESRTPIEEVESYLFAVIRRWMDPDGDGNPSDGVDGWISSIEEPRQGLAPASEKAFWLRLAEHVRKINPNAVMIANGPFAVWRLTLEPYDVAVDFQHADAIRRFFHPRNSSPRAKEFFEELKRLDANCPVQARLANLNVLSAADGPRLLTYLSGPRPGGTGSNSESSGSIPPDDAVDRWRLATIFQHFYPGAPVTYYGDEVGMNGDSLPFTTAPMWWNDLPDPKSKASRFRSDFFALVQWLHSLKEKYAPLRRGEFKPIWFDDERSLLAFARSLPGDEVILLMNYGSAKQEVALPVGNPGQLVTVLSPLVKAPVKKDADKSRSDSDAGKLKPLQVGGSRQFVNPAGTISLWVSPKSVRVVLLNDK